MRTYTDFNAWKTACRERGWTGPHWTGTGVEHQFVDASGVQKATWNAETNTGQIFDETQHVSV